MSNNDKYIKIGISYIYFENILHFAATWREVKVIKLSQVSLRGNNEKIISNDNKPLALEYKIESTK